MTEVFSGDAIADHHITPQYRKRRLYIPLRTLNVVTTMLGGGGVRAFLISLEPRKPLFHYFRRRISYFCSDRTVWKAKLHSTDADGVLTPPLKRGVMRVQEMYSPWKASAETSPTATGKADHETRPSK